MNKYVFLTFLFVIFKTSITYAQCVSNVNLNTWSKKGPTSAGNWAVSGGGTSVYQSINGSPTFFVNPQDLINVEITGQFGVRAGAGDNDMIGFVIAYKEPSGTNSQYDFLLFDWNKEIESNKPYTVALTEVKGTTSQCNLWTKTATAPGIVNTLQSSTTYPGWVHGTTYNFTCLYTSSRIVIKIGNTTVVDINGCFEPGKFGFYNYSQGKVDYSNFSYRSVTDFSIANDSICFNVPLAQADANFDLFCYGNTVTSPYNIIRWDMGDGTILNNTSTFTHTYSSPGVYNIKLFTEDLAGCRDSLEKTITVLNPNVTLPNDFDTCSNTAINLNATTTSPNIVSYNWNTNQTTPSISINTNGEYSIIATDDAGCKAYDTVNVVFYKVPNASFNHTNSCLNNQTVITDNSTIASGSITNWQWDFGDGNTYTTQNPNHIYNNDGTYTVQLTVTSDHNCTNSTSANHTIYALPINNAGSDITLNCQTVADTFYSPGVDSYQWNTPDGIINANDVPVSLNNTAGAYVLTATTINNCSLTDTAYLFIDTIVPILDAGQDSTLTCSQPEINLYATGDNGSNFSHLWVTPNGNIVLGNNTLTPTINKDGIYYITTQNITNFCSTTDSIQIFIDTVRPISQAGEDSIVTCLIPTIELNGTGSSVGNYSYLWTSSLGNPINNPTTLTPSINLGGYYYLTVTNNYSLCSSTDSVFIDEDITAFVDILSSSISVDTISGVPPLAVDYSWIGDNGTVNWAFGDNNFSTDSSLTHTFNLRGEYTTIIQLTDENGCIAYDSVTVIVIPREIIFPNVFTPNNDGINDVFSFRGENIKTFECSIYNRWGQIIYKWDTPVGGWDGRAISGKEIPSGQYYYVLKAVDFSDKKIEQKGTIMLMR